MCGISGFQGAFDPGLLERMNAILAHRGPDDVGGLGCRYAWKFGHKKMIRIHVTVGFLIIDRLSKQSGQATSLAAISHKTKRFVGHAVKVYFACRPISSRKACF